MTTRNYFFTIMLLALTIQVSAQFSIGLRGGVNNSWRKVTDDVPKLFDDDFTSFEGYNNGRNGTHFSLLIHCKLNKNFTAGFEPAFASRGTSFNVAVDDIVFIEYNLIEKLSYAEFPMILIAQLPFKKCKLTPYGKIGIGASFLTYGILAAKNADGFELRWDSEDPIDLDKLNTYDTGFYAGFGLRYKIARFDLFTEFNYYHGLIDVDPTASSKNRSQSLGIGFLFLLHEDNVN